MFLNPTTRDTLLSDLVNGSYNTDVINGSKGSGGDKKETSSSSSSSLSSSDKQIVATSQSETEKPSMTIATRDPTLALNRLNSV